MSAGVTIQLEVFVYQIHPAFIAVCDIVLQSTIQFPWLQPHPEHCRPKHSFLCIQCFAVVTKASAAFGAFWRAIKKIYSSVFIIPYYIRGSPATSQNLRMIEDTTCWDSIRTSACTSVRIAFMAVLVLLKQVFQIFNNSSRWAGDSSCTVAFMLLVIKVGYELSVGWSEVPG